MTPARTDTQKRADAERRRADDEVLQAVAKILTREHCRVPDALAIQIHQAYTGRHWAPRVAVHCPTHETIKLPCPLCPRGDDDDDDA